MAGAVPVWSAAADGVALGLRSEFWAEIGDVSVGCGVSDPRARLIAGDHLLPIEGSGPTIVLRFALLVRTLAPLSSIIPHLECVRALSASCLL